MFKHPASLYSVFLWLGAFFFSLPLIEPYEIGRLLAVLCAVAGVAAAACPALGGADGLRLPRAGVLAIGGLFWALTGLSAALSEVRYISFISFCTFSLMPLSALLFLWARDGRRAMAGAGVAAGAVLGVLALWALAQYFIFTDMLVYGQVRAPFANPNAYAALLAAGVLPALGVALTGVGRARAAAFALAALLIVAVMVIGGRAVPLALLGGTVVFALMMPGSARVRGGALFFVALVMAAGTALALLGNEGAAIGRMVTGAPGEASWFGRGPIWAAALAIAGDHPWTGTGIGTFFLYYPQYRLPADQVSAGIMAHSDPLQFWAELGTAGPILFYGFIAAALWRVRRGWARRSVPMLASFCALGVLVVHTHGDFDFYSAPVLCLAGLLLAHWFVASTPEGEGAWILRARPVVALPVCLLAAGALLFMLQGVLFSEMQARTARALALRGDMEGFSRSVNAANASGFGMNARPYMMAATIPLGHLETAAATMTLEEKQAQYETATGLLDRAEGLNPRLPGIPFYRARLLALYRPAGAPAPEDVLQLALRLDPQHLPSRMMLVERLHKAGRKDEAYMVMRDGLKWPHRLHDTTDFLEILGARALIRDDEQAYGQVLVKLKAEEEGRDPPAWPQPDLVLGGGAGIMD